VQIRVYYEDTDSGGVVYHTNYIKYCERARSELFFKDGIIMDKNGYFVVKNLCCDFIKSAQLGDLLEVKNKVKVLKKASSVLEQSIYLKNKLIFKATLTIVYMINGKISKIPQDKLKYFHDKIN
jgi:acyl-CoA thioester hydrolase